MTVDINTYPDDATLQAYTDGSSHTRFRVKAAGIGTSQIAASVALTTPNLGTPTALVATNATGTASGLTAGTVTTNANLTGNVTSVGNATTIASGVIVDSMCAAVNATTASRVPSVITSSWFPVPLSRVGVQATAAAPANFSGAAFVAPLPIDFNRVVTRATASVSGKLRMLFYQNTDGGGQAGSAPLIATMTAVTMTTNTNSTATPSETLPRIIPGIFWVLWGLDSGTSFTLRTFGNSTYDLMTANADSHTPFGAFTTATSAGTTPSTFDWSGATISTGDLAPVIYLYKV